MQKTQSSQVKSKSPQKRETMSERGKIRLKLGWGSEIRLVELPEEPQLSHLCALVREEFGHDNLEICCHPSPYWKMSVWCLCARHLPKVDRAGLCDAYCEIGMKNTVHAFHGYAATPCALRTTVIKKSLTPSWNEKLTILVDGRTDLTEVGPPKLIVKIKDWDVSGNPDGNMIGIVELDLSDLAAKQARLGQLKRIEAQLKTSLLQIEREMKAVVDKPVDYRAKQKQYQRADSMVRPNFLLLRAV